MVGCQKEESHGNAEPDAPEVIYAHTEEDMTKTTVSNDGTKCSILWSSGDKIARFATDGKVSRYALDTGDGQKDATFKSDAGTSGTIPTLSAYLAYTSLPIDGGVNDQISCSEADGVFTISHDHSALANQTYKSNAFDYRAFPMVAVSEDGNDFSFKNVCGALLLKLKGTSKMDKIVIKGLTEETISGAYTVSASKSGDPTINLTGNGKTITMDCGDCQLDEAATNFYVSVPPTPFESGFSVTLTDTDGFSRTYNSKSGSSGIIRSKVRDMPVIQFPSMEFDLANPTVGSGASYADNTVTYNADGYNRYVQFSLGELNLSLCKGLGLITSNCNMDIKVEILDSDKVKLAENSCYSPGVQTSRYVKTYDFSSWSSFTPEKLAAAKYIRIGVRSLDDGVASGTKPVLQLERLVIY